MWREKEISHCLIPSLLVARLQPETGKSIQASQLGNEKSRAGTQARVRAAGGLTLRPNICPVASVLILGFVGS